MKPLADQVLIEPIKDNKTASGILLVEPKEKPETGIVKARGIKVNKEIKKGDKVVYKKWVSTEIKYEGKDYVLISSENVLAIL